MTRTDAPTAWDLLNREARAGQRRYSGLDRAEHYQRLGANLGEGDFSDVSTYQRTLGDLVDPRRPGRMIDVINTVSRDVGDDCKEWSVARLLSMVINIEQEQQQPSPDA